jgi:hypothetical protein
MLRRTILGAFLLGHAGAALAQIGAPQSGWVPDGARIRPVYGISASAAVGAVVGTQEFTRIAPSAARNYVLLCAADTGIVSVYQPEIGWTPVEGAGIAPDSIVLSPGGSAAALWFSSIRQVQIVKGLPEAPSIRQLDVSFLGSAPEALAISDDGAWLAGSWLGDPASGVYAFGPNGETNRLPIEDPVTALAFFSATHDGTHDIAAASTAGLLRVTGIGGFAQVSILAPFADSSTPAAAVAVTPDNRVVIAVDRGGSILSVQIESGAATTLDCGCSPEGLFAMGPSAFRLTSLQNGAFKLFDAALGEVLFAPLALTPGAEGAAQ